MRLAKFEAKPSIKRAIVKLWRARSGGFNEKIGQTRRADKSLAVHKPA